MTVGLRPSKPALTIVPHSLEKFLKTQKNLRRPSPKIWNDQEPDFSKLDGEGVSTLTLGHPVLRILESCSGTIRELNQIQAQLIVSNLFQHPLASGRIIKKLCSSPNIALHAFSLFTRLEQPDAFICNTIMRSYVSMNDPHSVLTFYCNQMMRKLIPPNHFTFPILIKICADLCLIAEGEQIHTHIVKFGFDLDLFVKNSMIHLYSVCGKIDAARNVFDESSVSDIITWNSIIDGYVKNGGIFVAREFFDEMQERDVFSWNSMISGYIGSGDSKSALDLFELMPNKDVVSWNCLIDGFAKNGSLLVVRELFDMMPSRNIVSWNITLAFLVRSNNCNECLNLFSKMMEEGEVKPNEATLMSVLTSCANLGRLDMGKWVHSYIKTSRNIKPDILLFTALLTMYAKCGSMDSAQEVFAEMPERNVVSWNSMIMGYGIHGQGEKALEMFLEMEKKGPRPNDATFVCALCACTHSGLVLEGWWYFGIMRRIYNIEPKVEHYGCMVDLLGRAGLVKDSEKLINMMPMEGGPALWGALLSSCRMHSNLELGEVVAKRLIELKPSDIGPHLLLSNIYASKGKWDEVESVRKIIKEKGLHKAKGCSLLRFGFESSVSSVEDDDSVHKKSMVYSMLTEMGAHIKLSCRDHVWTN